MDVEVLDGLLFKQMHINASLRASELMATPQMRILIVADIEPNPNSGAAGTEYQTVKGLRSLGHRVDVIWKKDLSHVIKHGNLHYLLELPFSYWTAIKAKILGRDYDVIHINQPYCWYAAYRLKQSGFTGLVVNRSHGWEPNAHEALQRWRAGNEDAHENSLKALVASPMHFVLRVLYPRWAVKWADITLVSSEEDRDFILERYQIEPNRVLTLAQGVNQSFLDAGLVPMTASRSTKVLYVGQYDFIKAPTVIARVINSLCEKSDLLSFTWCCNDAHHGEVRALLSPDARARTSLVGWMPQEKLISLYDAHGFFLFPSYYEGFGKAFLEAMSRGCIVVCSNTGGMKDIVKNKHNGVLAPVGDVNAMVNGVEYYLAASQQLRQVSSQAAQDASVYTWQRFASLLTKRYQSSGRVG